MLQFFQLIGAVSVRTAQATEVNPMVIQVRKDDYEIISNSISKELNKYRKHNNIEAI